MTTPVPDDRPYLRQAVARREQAHRRAVLLGISGLILLGLTPVGIHHMAGRLGAALAGHDHLWGICLVAMHELLAPVHETVHVALLMGIAIAGWDRWHAWRRFRRLTSLLPGRVPSAGDPFARAAADACLAPGSVRIVKGLPNPAFTAGWISPIAYVAKELAQALSPEQLTAVLAHERAHIERRDPLRRSLLRFLAMTLFWLPALRRLADDDADAAELEADDRAARRRPLVLASAILALAEWRPAASIPGTSAFQSPGLLERRIRRLAGEEPEMRSHVTRRSLVGAGAALAVVWLSGVMMAHPLPPDAPMRPGHCEHHYGFAITHLFCLHGHAATSGHCPHATIASTT